ncbi:MAG: CoA ester lyase [Gemmatimonadetes bacterium]|nr:CoA ester lyase [Gemmatimonadota bacterium]
MPDIRLRRTILFFPATASDRYPKAVASGADAVCMDLEDAVAEQAKDEARRTAVRLLEAGTPRPDELILRINTPKTEAGLRDLLAVCELKQPPDALMLPKLTTPEEVTWVDELVGTRHPDLTFVAMIETGEALELAHEIAQASSRVVALLLGGVDLSAALRSTMDWDALLYARSRVVHAAATAGVDAIDMPFRDVPNLDALKTEARAAARLGFTGKTAIHPTQVPVLHEAFAPSDEEVARAKDVVAAYERNRGGVLLVDGKLVERPVILSAQRTLAIAAAQSSKNRT